MFFLRVDGLGELDPSWPRNPAIVSAGDFNVSYAIVGTSDGGFVATGNTSAREGTRFGDVLVVKLNAEGEPDPGWQVNPRTFGGTLSDIGLAVAESPDGSLLVAGTAQNDRTAWLDWFIAKLDPDGNFASTWPENPVVYGAAGDLSLTGLALLPDGRFVVAGAARAFGAGRTDAYIVAFSQTARRFVRGDSNADGVVNLADAIVTLGWMFEGGSRPACVDAADADAVNGVDVSDVVGVLLWLFGGRAFTFADPAPNAPAYIGEDCDTDETLRGYRLGCESPSPVCSGV